MNGKDLETMFGVSEEQLDDMAKPFEGGEWPEGKTTLLGRPRLADEEVRTVTFKLPVSLIQKLDELAKKQGCTRSDTIRKAVKRELAI